MAWVSLNIEIPDCIHSRRGKDTSRTAKQCDKKQKNCATKYIKNTIPHEINEIYEKLYNVAKLQLLYR